MPIRTWSIRILTLRGNSQIPISKGHLKSDGFMDRRILTLRTRGGATKGKERIGKEGKVVAAALFATTTGPGLGCFGAWRAGRGTAFLRLPVVSVLDLPSSTCTQGLKFLDPRDHQI